MGTLQQQLQRANRLSNSDLVVELVKTIKRLEKVFVDKNREQIKEDSSDIYGKALGYYSEATEYITTNRALLGGRNKIKYAGDPYTGDDTGDWLAGYYMKVAGGVLTFGSDDPKNEEILQGEHWLTTDFFGLTDENLKGVIEKSVLPLFLSTIRQKLDI